MVRLPPTSTLFPSPPPFRSCPAASASPAGLAPPRGACVRARLGPASLGRGRERVRRAGGRRRSRHAAGCDPRGCRRLRVLPAGPAAKATTPAFRRGGGRRGGGGLSLPRRRPPRRRRTRLARRAAVAAASPPAGHVH